MPEGGEPYCNRSSILKMFLFPSLALYILYTYIHTYIRTSACSINKCRTIGATLFIFYLTTFRCFPMQMRFICVYTCILYVIFNWKCSECFHTVFVICSYFFFYLGIVLLLLFWIFFLKRDIELFITTGFCSDSGWCNNHN